MDEITICENVAVARVVISLDGAALAPYEVVTIEDTDDLNHRIEIGIRHTVGKDEASELRSGIIHTVGAGVAPGWDILVRRGSCNKDGAFCEKAGDSGKVRCQAYVSRARVKCGGFNVQFSGIEGRSTI